MNGASGTVLKFNGRDGWVQDDEGGTLYVAREEIVGRPTLARGTRVGFDVGRGHKALGVVVLTEECHVSDR